MHIAAMAPAHRIQTTSTSTSTGPATNAPRTGFWALFGAPDPPPFDASKVTPETGGPNDHQTGFWALFGPAAKPAAAAGAPPPGRAVTGPVPALRFHPAVPQNFSLLDDLAAKTRPISGARI